MPTMTQTQTHLPTPVPTDVAGLLAYVLEYRPHTEALGDYLADTIGAERATRLLEKVESHVYNSDQIDQLRADLRDELKNAEMHVLDAVSALRQLTGNEVYDVEYADSGGNTGTMQGMLGATIRNLRCVMALNPFQDQAPMTSRQAILATADMPLNPKMGGFITVKPTIDMAALATIVDDGLGEFVRDEDSPAPIKPIAGVRLNEAGWEAANAAGASPAF